MKQFSLERQMWVETPEPPPEDALDYLRQVYRNPLESTHVRMRAARVAIEYERPRLAVTAVLSGEDYADRLERAIAASGVRPKMIEATPVQPVGITRRV